MCGLFVIMLIDNVFQVTSDPVSSISLVQVSLMSLCVRLTLGKPYMHRGCSRFALSFLRFLSSIHIGFFQGGYFC